MNNSEASRDGKDADLTPAAKEVLDTYAEEYRTDLLFRALQSRTSGSDVRVDDVRRAAVQAGKARRPTRGLALLTLAVAAFGLVVSVFVNIIANSSWFSGQSSLTIATAAAAVATAATSFAVLLITISSYRQSRATLASNNAELLAEVLDTEGLLRRVARERAGVESESLSQMLSGVEAAGLLTLDDAEKFRQVMQLRNSVVHQDTAGLSDSQRLEAASTTRILRAKLNEALRRSPSKHLEKMRTAAEYERRAFEALKTAALPDSQVGEVSADDGIKAVVDHPEGTVIVIIKYEELGQGTSFFSTKIPDASALVLFVVNREPTQLAGWYLQERSNVRYVVWTSDDNTTSIGWALGRLLYLR